MNCHGIKSSFYGIKSELGFIIFLEDNFDCVVGNSVLVNKIDPNVKMGYGEEYRVKRLLRMVSHVWEMNVIEDHLFPYGISCGVCNFRFPFSLTFLICDLEGTISPVSFKKLKMTVEAHNFIDIEMCDLNVINSVLSV